MAQTVVGLFDKLTDAQQAVQQLLSEGFTQDNVDFSTGTATTGTGTTGFDLGTSENQGSVKGFFKSLFGSDDDNADRYHTVASRSNSIVTVHAMSADEAERAADILDDNGAVNVDERAGEYGYTGKTATGAMAADTAGVNTGANADQKIKIIEENLEVGKRTVQTGGVRLKSRIVERAVEEQVRLRQERVNIDRTAVDRPATEADFAAFKEGTVEMTESAEVPVVSKQARVVEEVSLGKDVSEKNETVRDTVRKTEVDIENIPGTQTTSTDNSNMAKKN